MKEAKLALAGTDLGRKSLALLFIAALLAGVLNLCGLVMWSQSDLRPTDVQAQEQLTMPAVMPYDVWVIEPWGGLTVRVVLSGIFVLSMTFLLWQVWNLTRIVKANRAVAADPRLMLKLHQRAVWGVITFWVLGCILLIVAWQVILRASHGLPPYGFLAGIRWS